MRGIHRRPVNSQRTSNAENVSIWWRHHVTARLHHNACLPAQHPLEWRHMSIIASQITGNPDFVQQFIQAIRLQSKHQSSTSLVFVKTIHRWTLDSAHKGLAKRKSFPCRILIMAFFQWVKVNDRNSLPTNTILRGNARTAELHNFCEMT